MALRCLVVAAAAYVLWRLRHERDQQLWLGAVSGALLLATLLAASLAEMYWSVLLLPLLLTALRPASPMHNPLAWVGVYLFATTEQWTPRGSREISADYVQLRPTVGWLVLLLVVAGWAARRRPPEPLPEVPADGHLARRPRPYGSHRLRTSTGREDGRRTAPRRSLDEDSDATT